MRGQPQKTTNNIIKELNQYAGGDAIPDEFTLKKLRNEGEKLSKVDPVEGNVVLGIIATIARDEDNAIKRFKSAFNRSKSHMVLHNYAKAMMRFGRTEDAIKIANDTISMYRDNPSVLNEIADISFNAGFYNKAAEILTDIERLKGASDKQLIENTKFLGNHCKKNDVSEEDVSQLISVIYKVSLKYDIPTPAVLFYDDPSNSDSYLFMRFCVNGNATQKIVMEMNDDLVSGIATKNLPAAMTGGIVPSFSFCSNQ